MKEEELAEGFVENDIAVGRGRPHLAVWSGHSKGNSDQVSVKLRAWIYYYFLYLFI